jgi:hypothetical protein
MGNNGDWDERMLLHKDYKKIIGAFFEENRQRFDHSKIL